MKRTWTELWRGGLLLAVAAGLAWGCAHLRAGADPLVVRVEQTQSAAGATFDLVLHLDQADRGFWRTNAPAFHGFCEWLRTPLAYGPSTNVARAVLIQFNVDDLKGAYQRARTEGNSNALYTAWSALNAALQQAVSWRTIINTPTHP